MQQEIQQSLLKAESNVRKLRKSNSRFIIISLFASVAATLLAGLTAFNGPVAGAGPTAWRWTCGIVAVFTATATVFTGLQKQLTISERLSKATECCGKLKSLLISAELAGSDSDKKEIVNDYRKIIEVYSEVLV